MLTWQAERARRAGRATSRRSSALTPSFRSDRYPARGSWLVDEQGERWLDAYGGHAVSATGHSHPVVVGAIAEQAEKLLFYSTAVAHENRERLADELASRAPAPLSRVFFCNSGAEANENALNLARKVTGRRNVVSLEGGWHGRTAACLAVTHGIKYEEGALPGRGPAFPEGPVQSGGGAGAGD